MPRSYTTLAVVALMCVSAIALLTPRGSSSPYSKLPLTCTHAHHQRIHKSVRQLFYATHEHANVSKHQCLHDSTACNAAARYHASYDAEVYIGCNYQMPSLLMYYVHIAVHIAKYSTAQPVHHLSSISSISVCNAQVTFSLMTCLLYLTYTG
jgi:hypothetical protein